MLIEEDVASCKIAMNYLKLKKKKKMRWANDEINKEQETQFKEENGKQRYFSNPFRVTE